MDFDALYRGESPGEGIAPMTTPPWDDRAPSESVIAWQTRGWVHGDVLDIGCGLGDNAVYLAKGHILNIGGGAGIVGEAALFAAEPVFRSPSSNRFGTTTD